MKGTTAVCLSVMAVLVGGCSSSSESAATSGDSGVDTAAETASGGAAGTGGSVTGGAAGTSEGGNAGTAGSAGEGGSESGGSAGEGGSESGGNAGSAGTAGSAGEGGSGGTGGSGAAPPFGTPGQSCKGMTGKECQLRSCCSSRLVPGGSFLMGRSTDGSDMCRPGLSCSTREMPEHEAVVSDYYLDEFEVTVGRFRRFVEQYDGTPPVQGSGAHPKIPGSGWQNAWNAHYHATRASLVAAIKCVPVDRNTWRDAPSGTEQLPINCVNWYEAFAFCAWDGGRFPTEAEWEKAAAGGDENRLFPWGASEPDNTRASYNCQYDSNDPFCMLADIAEVGMLSAGAGRWDHKELAGNMKEWVLDWYEDNWYSAGGKTCTDCANLTAASYRVQRGGSFIDKVSQLRAVYRSQDTPTSHFSGTGFRCARDH